jgi:ribosomal-protein-alanine N-acetyltransferase
VTGSAAAVVVRPMAEGDLDAVHRLEVAVAPDPWSRELLAGELAGDRRDRHWLVAERDGAVVAFGGLMLVVDEAHVLNLAVDPRHRRRGLASRLLAALLLDAGDRGIVSATLEVRVGNRAGTELYRRFGFEEAGIRPRYYPDGEDASILWCHRIDRPDQRALLARLGGGDG